ncbi:MAG: twin-arginine translocase subunit TatB [Rhizobiales bacterium]|nr:twin-arginine translocase subunit TatB [Hyphomicrobiales bacterium]MBO6698399.1 twin-arginine translocase subunit TatB [Hyphomicrobiales bacterium]MBO6735347.1 twin-arginine translocase subunit TatB [Hyphomicrobiales bacterium]MBO6910845.1 twin-arginine translocase subunit TatB [Hyphomicrobiales bacterium]MBO6955901.1 twin-arginine translocase subunit TatB [Hyphomicrobiales bacterium]
MFDIGGVELLVIAAVAILVVGPRELPGMLRGIGKFVRQAREMTSTVQRQFNDALKEAELDDVKKTIDDVRSLNPATQIKRTIAKEMKPLTDVGDSLKTSAPANSIGKPEAKPTGVEADKTEEVAAKKAGDGSTLTPSKPRVKAAAAEGVAVPVAETTTKPSTPKKPAAPKKSAASVTPANDSPPAEQPAKKTGSDNGG